uniref:Lipocalin n=1 Tax=Rhipicephalus zambeziensis TaxID=60191 RepID=A0A224YBP0_9ACAR
MKYRIFSLYVTCAWAFFSHGSDAQQRLRGPPRYDKAHLVERIIGRKSLLIISRSIYFRCDYPICVQSCLDGRYHHVYRHTLSYFNKRKKVQKRQGPKVSRTAYMHVLRRRIDDTPILVINAFMGRNATDPKVSGRYDIFFATAVCFVVGTQVANLSSATHNFDRRQARNSACLLWRKAVATEQEQVPCRRAFETHCRYYYGYKFIYRSDICMSATHTEQSMCAIQ